MGYSVSEETLDRLGSYWQDSSLNLSWSSVFVLPQWLGAWWQTFGKGADLYLRSFRRQKELVGLAPLRIKDATAESRVVVSGAENLKSPNPLLPPARQALLEPYQLPGDALAELGDGVA
ncbi:MAG: hypothetical protein V1823_05085 [Chloroflexota bacterium]